MFKRLKDTTSFDKTSIVSTIEYDSINNKPVNIRLQYFNRINSTTEVLTIPFTHYTKTFLKNTVDSFSVTDSLDNVKNNIDKYLDKSLYLF